MDNPNSSQDTKKFTFADIEDTVTLGGFKLIDIFVVGLSVMIGIGFLNQFGSVLGLISCLFVVTAGFSLVAVNMRGKKLLTWLLLLTKWVLDTKLMNNSDITKSSVAGSLIGEAKSSDLLNHETRSTSKRNHNSFEVKLLKKISIIATPQNIGAILDPLNKKVIVLLKISKGQFGLLSTSGKDQAVDQWANTLNSIKESVENLSGIQIINITHPIALSDLKIRLNDSMTDINVDIRHSAAKSYNEFLDSSDLVHNTQSSYIAVGLNKKNINPNDLKIVSEIYDEILETAKNVNRTLRAGGFEISGTCTKKAIENVIKNLMLSSGFNTNLSSNYFDDIYRFSYKSEWDHLKLNSKVISTYWISSWPKFEVFSDFLSPLVLGCNFTKMFSLIISPIEFETAKKEAEAKLISHMSDDDLRSRAGFLNSATRAHSKSKNELLNYEIARGYETFKYSGYLSVTADTLSELKDKEAQIELVAAKCGLSLQKLFGNQDTGFNFMLPLVRGVR